MRSLLAITLLAAALGAAIATEAFAGATERRVPTRPATALYRAAVPAVVGISCRAPDNQRYYGTGAIVDASGLVVTSTTVVPAKARDVRIYLRGGRLLNAAVVATDHRLECTILKMSTPRNSERFVTIPLGNSRGVRVGESVYALGNAFESIQSDDQVAMSSGVISGLYAISSSPSESKYRGEVLETNAPVAGGMDGGPLIDASGKLVGMLSLSYSANRWLGTAIPVELIKPLLAPHQLWFSDRRGAFPSYVGVELEEIDGREVRILRVTANGPASLAGVAAGAVLTTIDGTRVRTLADFRRLFKEKQPGQTIVFETLEKGAAKRREIALWGKY